MTLAILSFSDLSVCILGSTEKSATSSCWYILYLTISVKNDLCVSVSVESKLTITGDPSIASSLFIKFLSPFLYFFNCHS